MPLGKCVENQGTQLENDFAVSEIQNQIKELFDLLGNSVNKNDKLVNSKNEFIRRQFGRLLGGVNKLSDSTFNTHKIELDRLAQHLRNILNKIQYPMDCNKTRILVCSLNLDRGFTSILHHAGFCLDMSTASNRTLVFEDEGAKLVQGNFKWTDVFLSPTNCSYKKHVLPFLPLSDYKKPLQQERIVFLKQLQDSMYLSHLPELAPLEYKEILLKHHTDPPAWFMGNLLSFIMRENATTSKKIKNMEFKLNLGNESIAGIHVRRTDKSNESPFHKLEEYMKWIDFWYNSAIQRNNTSNKQRLFIATDDPKKIIEEAEKRWGSKYEFLHNSRNASYGTHERDPQRNSLNSVISLLVEVGSLAKCKFVVCTFSSNVCRLIYELMQVYQGYAGGNVHSLDTGYAETWYDEKMVSVDDYKAMNKGEIDAIKGDIIISKGKRSNGFINSLNTRTNKEGKFPRGLLRKQFKFESFPIFTLDKTI